MCVVCPITHGPVDDRKGFVCYDLCGFCFSFFGKKILRTKDSNKKLRKKLKAFNCGSNVCIRNRVSLVAILIF